MRLPSRRILTLTMVLATSGLFAAIWFFWPQVYDTIRHADRVTVYEGLPHPGYEAEAFQEELRTKPTVELFGFPFYREPIQLKGADLMTLRSLIGARSTYQSYTGEKKCGGFHPDYALVWSIEGKVYRGLICFGCSEARFQDPQGHSFFYDLRDAWIGRGQKRLLELLKAYRVNRPPHERFGIGPLAVTSRL